MRSTLIQILVCCLIANGCIDSIEFEPPSEYQNTTAIIGKIVKGNPSVVEVSIQNLFDFTFLESSFVNAESVKIVDEANNKLEIPIRGPGEYRLEIHPSSGFDVAVGNSYKLEVQLFDGQSFVSDFSTLVSVPKLLGFEPELVTKEVINQENEFEFETRIEYRINTSLISETQQKRTNLKWDFNRTYKLTDDTKRVCYATNVVDSDLIQIVNEDDLTAESLEDYLVLEQIPSQKMVEGQYLFAIQEALDDKAIEFWEQAKELSTNSGTFYEAPPGQLITNFKKTSDADGLVYGYFYATDQDTLNVFIDSSFINQFIPVCPRSTPPMTCEECCDCQMFFPTKRPNFWVK